MEIFLLSFHCLDSMDYDRGCTIYNVMYEITIYQMMSSRVYHHFRIDIFYASKFGPIKVNQKMAFFRFEMTFGGVFKFGLC